SIDLDGAVSVTFSGTGEITLGTSPSSLTDLLPTIGTPTGTGLSINLPISVSGGGLDSLAQNLLQGGAFCPTISLPDPFDGVHEITFSSLYSFSGANLFDFGSLTPTSVLGLLGNVFTSFASVAGNSLLQTQIPFTGKTLGDALDFGKNFLNNVLNPIQNGGQPNFSSIQTLVAKLNDALHLPPGTLTADYEAPGTAGASAGPKGVLQTTAEIQTLKVHPTTRP